MDDSESVVLAFLESEGFSSIIYEPDGNVPPDFLLDGKIAVEVRRLNQHSFKRSEPVSLEELRYKLAGRVTSLLHSLGGTAPERSWFIGYRFARPAPSWHRIELAVRGWINETRESRPTAYVSREVLPGFQLYALPASGRHECEFLLGGFVDRDSGGFVISSLLDNIPHCVEEKEKKVAARRSAYGVWWLCLVDRIAYALDDHDRSQLEQWLRLSSTFDRIVLVSPSRPTNSYDLHYERLASR